MTSDEQWRVETVAQTASTNADVADRFRAGEGAGLVLVAEHQTSGRGRLGREWVTPPGSSLIVSFLLMPDVSAQRWSWLPLLTGVAAVDAVRRETGVEASLKWPNDVLVDGRKLAGILLERVEHDGAAAAIVGIGLNCHQTQEQLPVPEATSLALATGAEVDRGALLGALVEALSMRLEQWAGGEHQLEDDYRRLCSTIGQPVRVMVPGGDVVGEAVEVDGSGQLVVETAAGRQVLGVGDVVHVRPQVS